MFRRNEQDLFGFHMLFHNMQTLRTSLPFCPRKYAEDLLYALQEKTVLCISSFGKQYHLFAETQSNGFCKTAQIRQADLSCRVREQLLWLETAHYPLRLHQPA